MLCFLPAGLEWLLYDVGLEVLLRAASLPASLNVGLCTHRCLLSFRFADLCPLDYGCGNG